MSASHVVQVSKGFAWLKASQIAVSLAGVGVAAYIETRVIEAGPLVYINPILTIVGAFVTVVASAYYLIALRALKLYNWIAILAFECIALPLWIATMGLWASSVNRDRDFLSFVESHYGLKYFEPSVELGLSLDAASLAIAAVQVFLYLLTLTTFGFGIRRHRKAGGVVIQHRLSATPPASHIVSLPNTFKGLKVVQLVLSIAALGLSAYLLALTHLEGYAVAAVVAAAISLVCLVYYFVTLLVPSLYNWSALLVLECVIFAAWWASTGCLARSVALDAAYYYAFPQLVGVEAGTFGICALQALLCVATVSMLGVGIKKHREARQTATQSAPQGPHQWPAPMSDGRGGTQYVMPVQGYMPQALGVPPRTSPTGQPGTVQYVWVQVPITMQTQEVAAVPPSAMPTAAGPAPIEWVPAPRS